MSIFTQKHYNTLALELRRVREELVLQGMPACHFERVALALATLFKRDNPAFKQHKWMDAVNLTPMEVARGQANR